MMDLVVIRGIEIKITMNCHFTSMRMARIKKIDNKYWENIETLEPSGIAGRNVKSVQPL